MIMSLEAQGILALSKVHITTCRINIVAEIH